MGHNIDYNTTTYINKSIIYLYTFCTIFISLIEYYLTKDISFSIGILLFGLIIVLLLIHITYNKPVKINDSMIKIGNKPYKWDDITRIIINPNKYIMISLKMPKAIHRSGYVGVRLKYSSDREYFLKYDDELINIFKNKTGDKIHTVK